MKLYFMRFLSACVAVSTCALSSCSSDTYIGNHIPASSVPYIAAGARDYRDQPTDGISEIDAGRYIIDNREDKFSSGILEVCNSSFSVDGQLAEEIGRCISGYPFRSGFYLIDLETGMSCGYNADDQFSTASTVKAGFGLYCFKSMAAGRGSMSDTVVYKRKHHVSGSGVIQRKPFGTVYTVEQLMTLMLDNSDNIAYYMLLDYFGMSGYNEMIHSLGVECSLYETNKWGTLSPHELGLIWQEIYRFKDTCDEGAELWRLLTTNRFNEIKAVLGKDRGTIAHKSGWGGLGCHDAGVVCGEHAYVIAVMTDTEIKKECLHSLIKYGDRIMGEYRAWLGSVYGK